MKLVSRYSSPFQSLFKHRRRRLRQPLSYRQLLIRVGSTFFVIFIIVILINGDIPRLWYQALRNSPTDFHRALQSHPPLPAPPSPFRDFYGKDIAAVRGERSADGRTDLHAEAAPRYKYVRDLGQGREGVVSLYEDVLADGFVVIKSWFRQGRNPLPDNLLPLFAGKDNDISKTMTNTGREIGLRNWPTEIEASLIFGGLHSSNPGWTVMNASSSGGDDNVIGRPYGETYGILPAIDYFVGLRKGDSLALTSTGREAALRKHEQQYRLPWYLVMPLAGKSLEDLAEEMRRNNTLGQDEVDGPSALITDIDKKYRPGFDGALVALGRLHSEGYCHDDMKIDNVFTGKRRNEQFILGDLGNVRQVNHPYHQTVDFTGRNHWKDCRADDVRRLLMSYLYFLREVSIRNDGMGSTVFDYEFQYVRRAPWARLYWRFITIKEAPIRVADMLSYSENEAATAGRSKKDDPNSVDRFSEAGIKIGRKALRSKPLLSSYRRKYLRFQVSEELRCNTLKWQWAVWLWFYVRYGWLVFFSPVW